MKPSRTTLAIAAIAVVAATAVVLASTRETEPADASPATPRAALVVTTAEAERAALPAVIEASGVVAAWQEASVGSRSSGLPIVAVLADVGDTVRKGQLLARLDDSTVAADVARAEAALAQARAREAEARTNRDRALQLAQTSLLSKQDVLQATTNAVAAEAEVAQAEALLRAARLGLDHTRVLAPDDGVVIARSATLGAVAQPGTELFRFIRQGRLEWRAELTGEQLMQAHAGMPATVRTVDGATVRGRVRTVAPALDGATRTGIAYVDLEASPSVRASMYLNGELQLEERLAVTVPSASILVRDGRAYVAALDGDRVRLVPVVAGRRMADRTEIERGLEPGTTVAVRGAGFLNDGDVVRIAPAG